MQGASRRTGFSFDVLGVFRRFRRSRMMAIDELTRGPICLQTHTHLRRAQIWASVRPRLSGRKWIHPTTLWNF